MSPEEVRRRVAEQPHDRLADAVAWACYEALRDAPLADRPAILHEFAEFRRGADAMLDSLAAPEA